MRIAGPSPIPDLPGARTERRVQWSTPGNRLVFANCSKETLRLVIMDAHLKVLGRRSVANCAGLSPCSPQPGSWHYFDHEDCLIYDITQTSAAQQWRIVRYDFRNKKARVIRTAKYGVKYFLEHRDDLLKFPGNLPALPSPE